MGLGKVIGRLGDAANRKGRRFLRRYMSRKGGVAMTFALAFVPLSILTLTAMDFQRASSVKSALQDALDAAALAAARSNAKDTGTINTIGQRVLNANMRSFHDVTITSKTFSLQADGTVKANAQAAVRPMIANMFLGGDLKVNANAEVVRANDKLEIALVLDNTGSMADNNKIGVLRTAATNLVNDLVEAAKSNPEPDAIKLGLVPFSMTVRIGSTYSTANFMDRNALASYHDDLFDTATTSRWQMLTRMGLSWAGCVESRPYPYDVQETAPTNANPETLFVPYFAPDEPDVHNNRSNKIWYGYDVGNDYLPDGISSSNKAVYGKDWMKHQGNVAKYGKTGLSTSNGKGPNQGCTMQTVQRLTTNASGIKTAISNMVATGNTNIPMGLMWGWHVLSPQAPFADGATYTDDDVTKIVVLMTDGENVNSEANNPNDSTYSGLGYIWQQRLGTGIGVGSTGSQRTTKMNARLTELCSNMKARGIVIYTVGVQVNTSTGALLKGCASEAENYYNVVNVADLSKAFENIAAQISRLRISK